MNIKHAEYTSRGLVREQNEDAFLSCVGEDAALFLVADGIGGREGGEVASGMLQDGFRDWWDVFDAKRPRPDPGETAMEVRRRIMEINQAIQDKMGAQGSGSTLVLLLLYQGFALLASSGDSRIYRARGLFSWKQMTVDDIYENYRDPNEPYDPSLAGKLTAAIGIRKEPVFTLRTERLKAGDRYFLCSDGVYRFHDPNALRRLVSNRRQDPEKIVAEIAREVERQGAGDNYTMIQVRVEEL